MSLDHDLEQTSRERSVREKAQAALQEGKITRAEYDYFLRQEQATMSVPEHAAPEHAFASYAKPDAHEKHKRATATKVLTVLLALGFAFALLWALNAQRTPTGHVTFTPSEQVSVPLAQEFTQDAIISLNVSNTTSLRVTGTLRTGAASVWLDDGTKRLLVYAGDAASHAAVTTASESYALNETVDVTVTPPGAAASLWLTNGAGEKTPVESGFTTTTSGSYTLDALINDSENLTKQSVTFIVRDDADPTKDIVRQTNANAVTFTNACSDTCDLVPTNNAPLTLEITVAQGATLTIDAITTTAPRTNSPPTLTTPLSDVTITAGESATIDLSAHFTDPDLDTITYDFMTAPGVDIRVNGATLTITGTTPGTTQSVVYASDLYTIAQSNLYTITILPSETSPNGTAENGTATNTTINTTITPPATNETNVSLENATQIANATNMTATNLSAIDCSNPDPNARPLECIQGQDSSYFKPETLLLENKGAVTVAQLTPVGNLLLRGGLVERSAGSPAASDYALGYQDENGDFVATLWIDTATGDLHLRGTLTEANGNLQYQERDIALVNKRGIILALVDRRSGDLVVRGNLVVYRRSLG